MTEFYVGRHRVEKTERGYWLFPNNRGRGRFYAFGTPTAELLRSGDTEFDPEVVARRSKVGTHEPVYYTRDAEGKIGIPPEPGLPLAAGCTLHQAKSLPEVDALAREMNIDLYRQFQEDGSATRMFDRILGDPIETLKEQMRHPVSRMERDVIPLLIEDLENMERRNQRNLRTEVHFRERES